jgi:lipopolysaccharide biosynthesis glycosyltransferase
MHIITDPTTEPLIKDMFAKWNVSMLQITTYQAPKSVIDAVSWVPNHHYGGVYAMLKLAVELILPPDLPRVIFLDTDTLVLTDILNLWSLMSDLTDEQCIAMVENQSGWKLLVAILMVAFFYVSHLAFIIELFLRDTRNQPFWQC